MGILGYRRSSEFELWVISAGLVKMDGGAIFGVVPKPLWSKCLPPDDRNRVSLGMNCLLVRHGDDVTLIETGFGGKLSGKMKDFYGLGDRDELREAFDEVGIGPEAVSRVVVTHMHQDHAGGCTVAVEGGFAPAFSNARYFVQRGEWEDAEAADGQTVKGYMIDEVLRPLQRANAVTLLDGDAAICPGIRVEVIPGHTRCHQVVIVETGEDTFCFLGDLIPTTHHLRPIYVLAYDLYPRQTYLNKQTLMARASAENWIMVWVHDHECPWGRLVMGEKGDFVPVPVA